MCLFSVASHAPVNGDLALLSQASLREGVGAVAFEVRQADVLWVEQERYSVAILVQRLQTVRYQLDRAEVRDQYVHARQRGRLGVSGCALIRRQSRNACLVVEHVARQRTNDTGLDIR